MYHRRSFAGRACIRFPCFEIGEAKDCYRRRVDCDGKIYQASIIDGNEKGLVHVLNSRHHYKLFSVRKNASMKLQSGAIALLLLLFLAACGDTAPASVPPLTSLHVIRPSLSDIHRFPLLDKTVSDAKAVQRLYSAALALSMPDSSGGVASCSGDIGLVYHLTFLQKNTSVQKMDLDATGCRYLQISPTDARYATDSFVALFTKTIGIPSLVPGTLSKR